MPRAYLPATERRTQILRTAAEQFARHGFHATSVEDICRAAGLSPGGLYRHFGSKREIVVALVAADAEETAVRLESAVAGAGDPRQAVEAIVEAQLSPLADRAVA